MEAILDRTSHPDAILYQVCQMYGKLPYAGGVANQPAQLMEKWILIKLTYEKLDELDYKMKDGHE